MCSRTIGWIIWISFIGVVLLWQSSRGTSPSQSHSLPLSSDSADTISGRVVASKRRAAVILYGRLGDRRQEEAGTGDGVVASLRRLKEELTSFVVDPNAEAFDFTLVVRAESARDQDNVRRVWGDGSLWSAMTHVTVLIAAQPMNLTIAEQSVFGCGYRMWSNIEAGMHTLLEHATSRAEDFEWVMVLRSEIHLAGVFEFHLLNRSLFYVANACAPSHRIVNQKRSPPKEKYVVRTFPCRQSDPRSAPSGLIDVNSAQQLLLLADSNRTAGVAPVASCEHSVLCKKFYVDPHELALRSYPDYYMLGSMETMSRMFRSIVEDWHAGFFRKSAAHCNHGVLGGRILQVGVQVGRYQYHKAHLVIPRDTSWYPPPSLHRRLEEARMLMLRPVAYDVTIPHESSVCAGVWMCSNKDSILFSL